MTPIRVFHDADRDAVFVSMVDAAFPSRTLVAGRDDGRITLRIYNSDQMLVSADWWQFARFDGSGFSDPEEAFAYVSGECNRASARMPIVSAVAGEPIRSGMPLALSRADGTLRLARADTYTLAFVVGLASEVAAATYPARGVRTYVTLRDWTVVAGAESLAAGQVYFLAEAGGISLSPPRRPGLCSVRVGNALTAQTLAFAAADPIML